MWCVRRGWTAGARVSQLPLMFINTDKTDAVELLVRLDRYVAGNRKAFSVVTVPTP